MKNKKIIISLFAIAILAFIFTQKKGEEEINTELYKVDDLTPSYGDNLILSSIGEPSNLIPMIASDSASHEIANFLYISVLEYDENLEIVPYAAEKFEVLNNGKHLKFTLREDILWQDGTPLTADDVTFTYNLLINPSTPTPYGGDFKSIKKYIQTGKYSFEVFYDEFHARSLISWMTSIMPKHILENENIANTSFSRNPIGAGPFMLKDWVSGSRVTLEANPNYFKGRPYLNNIIYKIIPDQTTLLLEAQNRAIDYLAITPQQYLRQTQGAVWENHWEKYKELSFSYTYFAFNHNNPLFKDKEIRQALSYAIDREAIVNSVLLGLGVPAFGPYKPETWVYNTNLQAYDYNKEKAIEILEENGWLLNAKGIRERNGEEFSFTTLTNQGNDVRIKTATVMQAFFKEIGIDMSIRTVEWAAFMQEFVNNGNFDTLILSWNITQDPDLFDVWHSSNNYQGGLNFINYINKDIDNLLIKGRTSINQEDRKKAYDEFQKILHDEQPYLFLYVPYSLPILQKRFHNVYKAPAGIGHNLAEWFVPIQLQIYK